MFSTLIDEVFPAQPVYAHCDIPCGIYDPYQAQIAAHTVIRMVNLLDEVNASSPEPDFDERKRIISRVARLTSVKEEHAEIVKREVRILWGDYFKPEHLEQFPNLHETFWKAAKLCSKVKQEINMDAAKELQKAVEEVADIFEKSHKH